MLPIRRGRATISRDLIIWLTFRKDKQTNLIEDLVKLREQRINWDEHEKVNMMSTTDGIIISYKKLDDNNANHQALKRLLRPFGNNGEYIELEITEMAKNQRRRRGKSLKFNSDNTINFQEAPQHFLFERIASCSENNLISYDIKRLSEEFEHGFKINIGRNPINLKTFKSITM
jgi:hypothetical protein